MTALPNVEALAKLFDDDTFAASIGVDLAEWSAGTATAVGAATADQCNFTGTVHGGFLFSAADFAIAVAANSWGRKSVAVSIDIEYLKAARVGEQLVFTATEANRSRSLATYRVDMTRGDTLIAIATGVTFRTGDWHFGAEAWPEEWRSSH